MKFNKFISYILHPILVPTVATLLYFILLPKHTNRYWDIKVISAVFVGTYVLPLLFLSFLKRTNVIQSYHLENTEERKFPLILIMGISIVLALMIKKTTATIDLSLFFYGMTIALLIAFFLLYKGFKASLHMIGIGGLIGFFCFFSYQYEINILFILAIFFIQSGLIANSRLNLKVHQFKEIYSGLLIGFMSQIAVLML